MRRYNWQQTDWPQFTYSLSGLEDKLFAFTEKIGRISGIVEALPVDIQQLVDIGAFVRYGKAGGRCTSYRVNL